MFNVLSVLSITLDVVIEDADGSVDLLNPAGGNLGGANLNINGAGPFLMNSQNWTQKTFDLMNMDFYGLFQGMTEFFESVTGLTLPSGALVFEPLKAQYQGQAATMSSSGNGVFTLGGTTSAFVKGTSFGVSFMIGEDPAGVETTTVDYKGTSSLGCSQDAAIVTTTPTSTPTNTLTSTPTTTPTTSPTTTPTTTPT